MNEKTKKRYFINSLERGLSVLLSLSSSHKGLTLSELAISNKIDNATANRYLYTLKELGYLVQDPYTKAYTITPKVLSLGFPFLKNLDARSRVLPFLLQVNKEYDVSTECAILNGTEIMFVERSRSSDVIDLVLTVGSRLPVYCTGLGKAILAFMDPDKVEKLIDDIDFVRYTPYTITDKKAFKKELDLTRKRGYAVNNQEMAVGIKTLAVPILKDGSAEGSCGISININRLQDTNLEEVFIEKLKNIMKNTQI